MHCSLRTGKLGDRCSEGCCGAKLTKYSSSYLSADACCSAMQVQQEHHVCYKEEQLQSESILHCIQGAPVAHWKPQWEQGSSDEIRKNSVHERCPHPMAPHTLVRCRAVSVTHFFIEAAALSRCTIFDGDSFAKSSRMNPCEHPSCTLVEFCPAQTQTQTLDVEAPSGRTAVGAIAALPTTAVSCIACWIKHQ
jgi:hypothetical protein